MSWARLSLVSSLTTLLAAGQAMLAIYQGTAFDVSYILVSVAPLIISVVMLWSDVFSKATAYVGIVAKVFGLAYFVSEMGPFLAIVDVVGLVIWFILIGRRLFQLGHRSSKEEVGRS